jgi:hypothetical protein
MKFKHVATIQIGSHFLSAIFNADETGLTDEEGEQLYAFLYPRFKNCTFEEVDQNSFAHCEITKLAGDVTTLKVWRDVKTRATPYQYTTQAQLRKAFRENNPGLSFKKSGPYYNTDTRCTFIDWLDTLRRDGQIAEDLAKRATL